jgi:mannose-6-phosphate isomerase-like protein (cupin superfamily)
MLIHRDEANEFEWYGLTISDYTFREHLNSSVAEIRVPPGGAHPRSYSRLCTKYYFVNEGPLEFEVDDEWSLADAGDVVVVTPETVFRYVNSSESEVRLVLVHTPPFSDAHEVILDD